MFVMARIYLNIKRDNLNYHGNMMVFQMLGNIPQFVFKYLLLPFELSYLDLNLL